MSQRDGRSTRWDPHRQERRAAIISAAVAAIEAYGPDALTGQIAELAGVPRTHVYRHFDGKAALDIAVSTHVATQIAERVRGGLMRGRTPRQIIRASIDEHLGWIEEHPNLYRFLAQHAYAVNGLSAAGASDTLPAPAEVARAADAKAVFAVELTALLRRFMAALGSELDSAERLVVGVVGLVDATASWWLDRREPERSALAQELTEQVWVILDHGARQLGLTLAPDQPLPAL